MAISYTTAALVRAARRTVLSVTATGWSLGQRNGRPATWVDLAGIDPRDQTQGIQVIVGGV